MIPLLQFDPSTLTLWYDIGLMSKARGWDALEAAFHYAWDGKDGDLSALLENTSDQAVKARCMHVASSVWHEKRHFLDFVLSNYGAFRVRQFFEIYLNLPAIIGLAKGNGGCLHCPIDVYLDHTGMKVFGISSPDSELVEIAAAIAGRKRMIADDRQALPVEGGLVEVGGEAQLEALAYGMQFAKINQLFDADLAIRVLSDCYDAVAVHNKYLWPYRAAATMGIAPIRAPKSATSQPILEMDATLVNPMLYAALASRHWGQEQVRTEAYTTAFPAERLAGLLIGLRDSCREYDSLTIRQAWEMVNDASKALFGRTVIEEIEEDYRFEAEFCERIPQNYSQNNPVKRALVDFHLLRGDLIEILKNSPELVLSAELFGAGLVGSLQPTPILASSYGQIGIPPDGYAQVFGYKHPDTDVNKIPEARWWWAAIPIGQNEDNQDRFSLKDREAWALIIGELAPFAKLLLNGHRHRIMLGPELLRASRGFAYENGLEVKIEAFFETPPESSNSKDLFYLTGQNELRCDLTNKLLTVENSYLIPPWRVRSSQPLFEFLMSRLGKGDLGRLRLWRDWSPWIVSSEFREDIECGRFEILQTKLKLLEEKDSTSDQRDVKRNTAQDVSSWTRRWGTNKKESLDPFMTDSVKLIRHIEAVGRTLRDEIPWVIFAQGTCVSLDGIDPRLSLQGLAVERLSRYEKTLLHGDVISTRLRNPTSWIISHTPSYDVFVYVFLEDLTGELADLDQRALKIGAERLAYDYINRHVAYIHRPRSRVRSVVLEPKPGRAERLKIRLKKIFHR